MLRLAANIKPAAKGHLEAPKEKAPFLPEVNEPTSLATPDPLVGKGRRILVADDNLVVLKAFDLKLKALGFEVTTTTNGEQVASAISRSRAELAILDINFPSAGSVEWNGFMIIQWLRRFPQLASVPIILITGEDTSKHKAKALAAGVVALFEKPVDFKQLLPAILTALGPAPPSPGE
jgi:CheY-like chemotaxis protein